MIGVVHPSNSYCDSRRQHRQKENPIENAGVAVWGTDAKKYLDKSEGVYDDAVKQEEHPIFFPAGPPIKHRILL